MLRELIRLAGIIGRVSGDGSTVSVDAESLSIVADRNIPDVFVARITEADNAGNYGWVRQHPADETSGWEDQPDGMTGTLEDDPARELNGSESVEIDSLCVMFPSWASEGGSGTTPVWMGWRFIGAKAPAQGSAVRLVTALETGEVAPTGKAWLEPAVLQTWNSTDGDWEDTDPPVYVLAYRPSKHTVGPSSDGDIPFPATFLGYFTWTVEGIDFTRAVYQIDQQVLAGGADENGRLTFTPGTRTNYVYDLSGLIFNHGLVTYGSLVSNPTGLGQLEVNCLPATPNNAGVVGYYDTLTYDPNNTSRLGPQYQWLGKGIKGVDTLMVSNYVHFGITAGGGSGGTPADSYYSGQLAGNPYIYGGAGFLTSYVSSRAYVSIGADTDDGSLTIYTSGLASEVNAKAKAFNFSSVPEGITDGTTVFNILGTFEVEYSETHFYCTPGLSYMSTTTGSVGSFRYQMGTGRFFYGGGGSDYVDGNFIRGTVRIGGGIFIADSLSGTMSAGQSLTVSGTDYFKNGIFIGSGLPPVTGTVGVANGGTGATSFTSGAILYGNGTSPIQAAANASIVAGVLTVTDGSNTISFGVEEE